MSKPSHYVSAGPDRRRRTQDSMELISHYQADLADPSPAFLATGGQEEHTSGRDRAFALIIRQSPLVLLWAAITVGLGLLFAWSGPSMLLVWGLACIASWLWVDRTEYQFSRGGIERLKITKGAEIMRHKLDHDAELRRELLRQYLEAGRDE